MEYFLLDDCFTAIKVRRVQAENAIVCKHVTGSPAAWWVISVSVCDTLEEEIISCAQRSRKIPFLCYQSYALTIAPPLLIFPRYGQRHVSGNSSSVWPLHLILSAHHLLHLRHIQAPLDRWRSTLIFLDGRPYLETAWCSPPQLQCLMSCSENVELEKKTLVQSIFNLLSLVPVCVWQVVLLSWPSWLGLWQPTWSC